MEARKIWGFTRLCSGGGLPGGFLPHNLTRRLEKPWGNQSKSSAVIMGAPRGPPGKTLFLGKKISPRLEERFPAQKNN